MDNEPRDPTQFEITTTVFHEPKDVSPPPSSDRRPFFVVVRGPTLGQFFPIPDKAKMTIGRSNKNDIIIKEISISRHHCQLLRHGPEHYELVDLQSSNGLFVNGYRIHRHHLQDGDKVQLGSSIMLKFNFQSDLEHSMGQELYDSTTKDPLTGIHSKRYFTEQLTHELSFHDRSGIPLALVMFDIDHFKKLNDSYGHPCGDYVLETLSKSVNDLVRRGDTFARVGGEEFAVLLRDTDLEGATKFAGRMQAKIKMTPFSYNFQTLTPTVSVGIASVSGTCSMSPEELVQEADRYLYVAKQNGRNRIESAATESVTPRKNTDNG